ncbi:hypothetical protein CHS0354_001960 [Potamilus streckersoni]|uniref:Glycosyl hydrolase family 4 C-terminal domain-containing protein n=1 Tax=Potamilus streckersoni TaxID=2493646 RepID=A0AAE0W6P8_9BIVA|nr:hypothetical protein CHS0354_001960 [Potamilus streckersoni]
MANITLIGAGSAQFGYGTIGDIFCFKSLAGSEIRLLDINPVSLKKVETEAKDFIARHNLPFTVKATTDRPEALKGADFVIISIEVGDRFALWDMDWSIPQQYGIRQVYGENGGPGGLFHSLRIIPPILDICADVQKICPKAFVFNYSNPMSRICTTVHRKFPDLKFIGLCHEIASLERHLPVILDTEFENLNITAGGLNHFSVLLEAGYKNSGKDAYADIRRKAPDYFRTAYSFTDILKMSEEAGGKMIETEGFHKRPDIKTMREWGERGVFKAILERFDLLPITTDSHFGEYLAWAYDAADHRAILDFYTYYRRLLTTQKFDIEMKVRERIAVIMDGIVTDSGYTESAVNIPNNGYIRELPDFIAVEVPAKVSKKGIEGIRLNELPRGYAGILRNQVAIHDMTAEAVLTGSKKAVVQALLVDPIVNVYRGLDDMVDVMISKQNKFLGYLK